MFSQQGNLLTSSRNGLFHVSGTDIVRCLAFRFQAFGRPVRNAKKFEEGIFSDLRNLKAGTDASLEEPKSPFLDFLYKNNCIRTQKKQKVFYWFSVGHDRLFLDALERDLKREKMGQEPTTQAVAEPALSFEFDTSQSLYDQLSKTQPSQATFGTDILDYAASTSPEHGDVESMPPPSLPPPQQPMAPQAMLSTMPREQPTKSRDADAYVQLRQAMPLSNIAGRHSSMPAYMEYSPAPSFASSHLEDYSNRGLSYEPLTPPMHSMTLPSEPAYITNEDIGLYSTMPELGVPTHFHNMPQYPSSSLAGPQYVPQSRSFVHANGFIAGSPTYKQNVRRRSSSAARRIPSPSGFTKTNAAQHVPRRPSILSRSTSASAVPFAQNEGPVDAPKLLHGDHSATSTAKGRRGSPRHHTPYSTVEAGQTPQSPPSNLKSELISASRSMQGLMEPISPHSAALARAGPGVFRRARSATMMELGNPYPTKSHSCPIPSCGRLFKRLEHLKRHVRTHTQERPYVCNYCSKAFSRSDNLAQYVVARCSFLPSQQAYSTHSDCRHRRTHEERGHAELASDEEYAEDLDGDLQSQSYDNAPEIDADSSGMQQHQHQHPMTVSAETIYEALAMQQQPPITVGSMRPPPPRRAITAENHQTQLLQQHVQNG